MVLETDIETGICGFGRTSSVLLPGPWQSQRHLAQTPGAASILVGIPRAGALTTSRGSWSVGNRGHCAVLTQVQTMTPSPEATILPNPLTILRVSLHSILPTIERNMEALDSAEGNPFSAQTWLNVMSPTSGSSNHHWRKECGLPYYTREASHIALVDMQFSDVSRGSPKTDCPVIVSAH